MTTFGENISLYRRAREMTQEALGASVGVSMQAVSKWENGGVPDATLIPTIAHTLGVSTDALFGLESTPADVELAILREVSGMPRERRMHRAFELCWALERAIGGTKELEKGDHIRRYFDIEESIFSQMLFDSGVTLMKLNRASHYFFLSPEPEKGWARALTNVEEHTKLFALFSQRDAYQVLLFVYQRDNNPFTAKLVEKQLGISVARSREILAQLAEYKLVTIGSLDLDDETIEIFTPRPSPSLIGFLTFAVEICSRPRSYSYNSITRTHPYL